MTKRFRRQMLRDFRAMAAEGYAGNHDRWGTVKVPARARQRWRWMIRLWAKAQRWKFADIYVWHVFGGGGR